MCVGHREILEACIERQRRMEHLKRIAKMEGDLHNYSIYCGLAKEAKRQVEICKERGAREYGRI